MLIEICANSFLSASNAQLAGADRIELCTELAVGGITPSYGLIKKVTEELDIPVYVLIRPRSGNFCYDDAEFDIMKRDIEFCREIGCAGIVSGVLTRENDLDAERTGELVNISGSLPFTFHRAFDWVDHPLETADRLHNLGVKRILTSGQKSTAFEGMDMLIKLQKHCQGHPAIMPGGGVNVDNITDFLESGFREIHFSATTFRQVLSETPKISMNSLKFQDETAIAYSDIDKIEAIISKLQNS
ncbi:copper homeostasis protein CutC [Sinomicrobium sp. M5D2P17]